MQAAFADAAAHWRTLTQHYERSAAHQRFNERERHLLDTSPPERNEPPPGEAPGGLRSLE